MAKRTVGVRIDDEALEKIKTIVAKNPNMDQSLFINIAISYLIRMDPENLNKAIGEYFTNVYSL